MSVLADHFLGNSRGPRRNDSHSGKSEILCLQLLWPGLRYFHVTRELFPDGPLFLSRVTQAVSQTMLMHRTELSQLVVTTVTLQHQKLWSAVRNYSKAGPLSAAAVIRRST